DLDLQQRVGVEQARYLHRRARRRLAGEVPGADGPVLPAEVEVGQERPDVAHVLEARTVRGEDPLQQREDHLRLAGDVPRRVDLAVLAEGDLPGDVQHRALRDV